MAITMDTLELEIIDNSRSAANGLDLLSSALGRLKAATSNSAGLNNVSKQLVSLSTTLSKITGMQKIDALSSSLNTLASIPKGNLTTLSSGISKLNSSLSSLNTTQIPTVAMAGLTTSITQLSAVEKGNLTTIASGISNLTKSISGLSSTEIPSSKLTELYVSIQQLSSVGKGNLSSISKGILKAVEPLKAISAIQIPTEKITQLARALEPLTQIGKSNFNSIVSGLLKIKDVTQQLSDANLEKFATQIQRVATAMRPLADEAAKVYIGLKWLPSIVNKVIGSNGKLSNSNYAAAKSYNVLGLGISSITAKFGIMVLVARHMGNMVGVWITKSNEYVENLNLFDVSMGKYAQEALEYAQKINKSMGVDMSEWIRNQGIIMDMSKSFGVAEETAYKMSKALTQLAYDYSSLYNIKVVESMQKVQSAIAGEIEPVRRLGKDISVARLQTELLSLGFDMNVESMTQSEKTMLRTISLLKQSTSAMGDYSRTLESPANQMRIFSARVGEMVRALGNMFIPMISAVLPYLTAFVQIITEAASAIALFLGFELPKFDYSGMESVGSSIGGIEDGLDDATSSAKKLKGMLAGFDELNVIQPQDTGASAGAGIGNIGLSDALTSELDRLTKDYDEIFGNSVKQKTEEITKSMKAYFESLIPFFEGIGTVLLSAWDTILKWNDQYFYPWLVSVGEWAKENPETLKKIGEWIAAIAVAFSGWTIIKGLATPFIFLFKVISGAKKVFEIFGAGGAIGKLFLEGGLFFKIGVTISKAFSGIAPLFSGIVAFFSSTAGLIAIAVAAVVAAIAGIIIYWDELKVFFTQTVPAWWSGTVVPFFQNMWNGLTENVSKAIGGVKSAWDKFVSWLGQLPENIGQIVGDVATVFVEFFTYHIPNWINSAKEWFNQMVENIKLAFLNTIAAIKKWGDDTWMYLLVEVPHWILSVVTWFSELPEKLFKWLFETYKKIVQWGSDTWNWVVKEVPIIVSQFVVYFMELPEKLYNAAKEAIQSFWNGIKETWNNFKNWWSDIWSDFKEGFNETFNPRISVNASVSKSSVQGYASGGFPQSGEFFIARENGIPEMVGAIGNRTAVANNDQIVSSVTAGVSKANEAVVAAIHAMANAMVNAYVNNQPIVAIGEKEIAKVAQAGMNRLGILATAP